MNRYLRPAALLVLGCSLVWGSSWLTYGGDQQRDGWAKDETLVNKDNVNGLELGWKIQLDNEAKELNSLTTPLILDGIVTSHGFKEYVFVAGSSDNLYAIDADTGKLVWQKHFTSNVPVPKAPPQNWLCPNGLNDTPVISKGFTNSAVYVISTDGKLHALNPVNGEDRFPPTQFVPPYSKNWSLNVHGNVLYTSVSQGCGGAKSGVWSMDLGSPDRPVKFFQSDTSGGGVWGRGGVAIGLDGTVYAETGDGPYDPKAGKYADTFLALSPKDLTLKDYYTPANRDWITRRDLDMGNITPVVFPYRGRDLIVGAGKEGSLYLLDSKSLGGETHRKPMFHTGLYTNADVDFAGHGFWGSFASWEDSKGTRWVYAPALGPMAPKAPAFPLTNGSAPNGSIMAFKVEDGKDGQPILAPAWISRDMNSSDAPIIANGIVFAVSSGEFNGQVRDDGKGLYTSKERAEKAVGNATLYAFDAETGKELYSSGKIIPSFTHFGATSIANGHVYVTTYDNTVYSFRVKQD